MNRKSTPGVLLTLAVSSFANVAFAAESSRGAEDLPFATVVARAVTAGLQILEKGTLDHRENANCFTCHHQTLPMLAQATARKRGFAINEDLFRQQTAITHDGFKERHDKLIAGTGIGGESMSVGYALWALDIAHWKPDDTTDAMVAYLLKTQRDDGRFYVSKDRPPLEDSPATSVTIAAYYLQKFAGEAREAEAEASVTRAKRWLLGFAPERQEDRNARLWGLHLLDAGAEEIAEARRAVLHSQREDGGWSQLPDMTSDSYATGQALWMLHETGLAISDPAYERGARFLLDTQLDDGSWRVTTRSKPIQTYYESGFPHGKDQFISICGTSWAVAALALATPDLVTPPMTNEAPAAGIMPYVQEGRRENTVTWWGDRQATVDYCKLNLPRLCERFGGDLDNVFLCGFSRGAIAVSYIGLADDEIAALWKGIFTHDDFRWSEGVELSGERPSFGPETARPPQRKTRPRRRPARRRHPGRVSHRPSRSGGIHLPRRADESDRQDSRRPLPPFPHRPVDAPGERISPAGALVVAIRAQERENPAPMRSTAPLRAQSRLRPGCPAQAREEGQGQ